MQKFILICLMVIAYFKSTEAQFRRRGYVYADMMPTEPPFLGAGFLSACGTELKKLEYYVDAKKCTHGITMKEPFVPGCVCLRGVWVLQSSICGNKPVVIVGKSAKDCYDINFNITSFLHLGDTSVIFKTLAWVAPYHMTTFMPIPLDGTWTPYLDFKDPVIIAINPTGLSFEAEERLTCFRPREVPPEDQKEGQPMVHVWLSGLPKTRYRVVQRCYDPLGAGYDEIATVTNFYYHGHDDSNLPIQGCPKICALFKDGTLKPNEAGTEKRTYAEWLSVYQQAEKEKKERLQATFGMFNPMFGRKKRDIVNCEMVWEGRAFCLKSYWEPLEKIHISEKDKKICYPPKSSSPPAKRLRYG